MAEYELVGEERIAFGTGATRRLRKDGKVPAILFGGDVEPLPFVVNQNEVRKHLENEAFSSPHIAGQHWQAQRASGVGRLCNATR